MRARPCGIVGIPAVMLANVAQRHGGQRPAAEFTELFGTEYRYKRRGCRGIRSRAWSAAASRRSFAVALVNVAGGFVASSGRVTPSRRVA